MKSSTGPCVALAAAAALLAVTISAANAQDAVTLKNGQTREGKLLRVSPSGNVVLKVGPAETLIPLGDVASVNAAPPQAYHDALKAFSEGNHARALVLIRPVVDSYRGLPAPWAERASALLGESLLQLDQIAEAEKAFDAFTKAYPTSTGYTDVGVAAIAVAKKDYATARKLLEPLAANAGKTLYADPDTSARLGQTLLLLGQIKEADGDLQGALENYLKTVTVFYADAAVASEARKRADSLMNGKKVVAP